MEKERLQKILAHAGYGSRRACEKMIEEGRVTVDGRIAQLGDQADPSEQQIEVDGAPIPMPQPRLYIMLNKPRGVISTTSDPQGRQTVVDLVSLPRSRRSEPVRLYPVGRLDAESEGLILLTNDGALTERLTHPRYEHPRIYRVLVEGEPDEATLDRWRRGITLDGRPTRFDKVYVEEQKHGSTWLRITVHEGRKHLVRRVVAALGHPPKRLIRVAMGPLQLGDLPTGKWRYLTSEEVERLRREMGTRRRSRRGGAGRKKPSQPSRREAGKSGGRSSPRSRRRSQ